MWHPLSALSPGLLGWLLLLLLLISVLLFVRLESLGRRLKTGPAPLGIVSLEISLSAEQSETIIDSWDEDAREDARKHLCLDYVLIPFFSTALAILAVIASRWFVDKGMHGMANFSIALAWGQWIAGLFEFAENSTLLRVLDTYPTIPDRLPRMAGWCARTKFLLILLAVLICLFGLVTSMA